MLLKNSAFVVCSSNCINPSSSMRSQTARSPPTRPPSTKWRLNESRVYSTNPGDQADLGRWPKTARPTPYEILDHKAGTPYNKARFHELVKLYHPDRYRHGGHNGAHQGLSHAAKLERYRLIVAANDILCDPLKQRAYEMFGSGWGQRSDAQNDLRTRDKSWRASPNTAAYNATWEDWEQWYHRRSGREKQVPTFMSNGGFALLVVTFVIFGAWGQANRASKHSMGLRELRDQKHDMISKELRERQAASAPLSKEARVQNFLRQREGWENGGSPGVGHLRADNLQK